MGSYDAEIRVSTKVDTSQMQRLQLQIDKAVGKVDALTKKYGELKNKKIPTQGYSDLQNKLKSAQDELAKFILEEEKLTNAGLAIGAPWDNVLRKEADAQLKIESINAEMQKLVDTGKDFTIGSNKEEIAEAANELARAKSELRMLVTKQDELERKSYKASDGLKKIGSAAKKMFGTITAYANKFFGGFQKNVKKTSGSLGVFSSRLKGIALSLLVFNWITKGFNSMVAGMKEGFKNLIQYSDDYNKSISALKSANTQLKNSFANAFAPVIQLVIPYIVQLINYVTAAANAIAQFVAVLTGKSTWIKAIAVQEDYAASLDGTASSAKKAAGALAKFDDLDVLNKSDSGNGGGAGGIKPGDMFEEVPINPNIEKLAKKFKDILSKLFEPLKEAWNRQGKFVMDSWKYALEEVRKLIKDIGRDFLTVWTQEDTIKMFEDILIIIGDIGLIVGHLANGFHEAWNEGETGLHILENIRDIIAIIIHNFRLAADETVKWTEQLNFTPLLTAFECFTAGFVQVADFLSGVLADFYTKVLLPLGQWVIEKGLPDLLDIFTRFCYEVDWEKLRTRLAEFWEHLEPFAETIGEGLIIFIDDLSKVLKDFANSEVFEKFLSTLEKWMDDVEPEDVANALELIAGALVTLKLGLLGFGAISALDNTFKIIKSFIGYFMENGGVAGTITKTASSISTLGKALTNISGFLINMNPGMIGELGIKIGDLLTGSFLDPREWDGWIGEVANEIDRIVNEAIEWVGENVISKGFERLAEFIVTTFDISNSMAWFDAAYEDFKKGGFHIIEGVIEGFVGAIALIPETIVNFFNACWKEICNIFGIHSPAAEMKPLGEFILLGIIEGFTSKISEFTAAIQLWWEESIMPWFTAEKWYELIIGVIEGFTLLWEEVCNWWNESALVTWWEEYIMPWFTAERWMELAHGIVTGITNKWNELVAWWGTNISAWWTNYVVPWFTVERWKTLGEQMKNGIFSGFKGLVNKVVDILNDVIASLENMLNMAIAGINSLLEKVSASPLGEMMGLDFSIGSVSFGRIPHLADGAVIRGGNPFMAILGDQRAGQTNIEAPQSAIMEAVEEGMSRAGGYRTGSVEININYDGETFARLAIKDFLAELDRQGYDIDMLGGLT